MSASERQANWRKRRRRGRGVFPVEAHSGKLAAMLLRLGWIDLSDQRDRAKLAEGLSRFIDDVLSRRIILS